MTDLFDPEVYDDVYADFLGDVPHVVALMKAAGGRVLEVCCGNGRILIPALEAGVPVDGLDLSPEMLADLRRKLGERNLSTETFEGDMRDFSLPHRYALIVIPFNSFLHNLTQADQLATLACCRRHLAPGGRLAIVIFHPSAPILIQYGSGVEVPTETRHRNGKLVFWDVSEQDRVEQVQTVRRRLEYFDESGGLEHEAKASFRMRWIYKPEMELLLRVAGFAHWEVQPFFTNYRDPASRVVGRGPLEGDHLLYTAWMA